MTHKHPNYDYCEKLTVRILDAMNEQRVKAQDAASVAGLLLMTVCKGGGVTFKQFIDICENLKNTYREELLDD